MNQSTKTVLIVLGSVVGLLLFAFIAMKISYNNSAADAEQLVIQAKDNCAVTYDNGIKAIIEMAQVDSNTKEYLKSLFEKDTLPAGQAQQVQQAYGNFVNGNPAQLMLLLGSIGNTNFTITAENVQREISSQRGAMLSCSMMLNSTQAELKKTVGMNASGRVVKFPQSMLGLGYPSPVSDPNLRDNDLDGSLTVLDYRPPVNVEINQAFGTGEGIAPTNIYGQP